MRGFREVRGAALATLGRWSIVVGLKFMQGFSL